MIDHVFGQTETLVDAMGKLDEAAEHDADAHDLRE
jgi:hypothetical protein